MDREATCDLRQLLSQQLVGIPSAARQSHQEGSDAAAKSGFHGILVIKALYKNHGIYYQWYSDW
jgi:hypothetical protein